eukprot:TRINITY_DN2811_c0_g1_i1.p1 TRINITY_DN2811_c0_g1~~TRINITY_DN2811_c0_g1_i1.p1  ORF type:complete len:217 (-),score=47.88 TRINITY_DN2811_c0_g1_i1:122-772(-)
MVFKPLLQTYLRLLNSNPVLTKMVTMTTLMAAGDVMAQKIENRQTNKPVDFVRTLRFAGVGFCFSGPLLHLWYKALEKYVGGGNSTSSVVKKILLDQLVFTPPSFMGFVAVLGTLEGKKPEQIVNKIQQDMWNVLKVNWIIWPAAQYINFRFVPVDLRVLFVGAISLGWNSFLSSAVNNKQTDGVQNENDIEKIEKESDKILVNASNNTNKGTTGK